MRLIGLAIHLGAMQIYRLSERLSASQSCTKKQEEENSTLQVILENLNQV